MYAILAVVWFLVAFALLASVVFSQKTSLEVARKDLAYQIIFSLAGMIVNYFWGTPIVAWLWGASAILIAAAKFVASRRRRRMMTAFK